MDSADTFATPRYEVEEGGRQTGARKLFSAFGVSEESGAYVLIIGLIFIGVAVIGCCYCKVYDPCRKQCIKMWRKICSREPKTMSPPLHEEHFPAERKHWYLNKTLKIDAHDRQELGPIRKGEGMNGGWYGARNGGFNT